MTRLEEVRAFWESNPLWTGESSFDPGSLPFFEEHHSVYIGDCFSGAFDLQFLPPRPGGQEMRVLDLGCGIGFWVSEFAMRGLQNLVAAVLTDTALAITAKRLDGYGLKGRGREEIFLEGNVDEIVRLYDGAANPIGKSYTRDQFVAMLGRHFAVKETYLHFFPARALPLRTPTGLHRWLDRNLGFMIYATVRKPCAA